MFVWFYVFFCFFKALKMRRREKKNLNHYHYVEITVGRFKHFAWYRPVFIKRHILQRPAVLLSHFHLTKRNKDSFGEIFLFYFFSVLFLFRSHTLALTLRTIRTTRMHFSVEDNIKWFRKKKNRTENFHIQIIRR